MKRLDALKGLLVLVAILLAATLVVALKGRQELSPPISVAAAQGTPQVVLSPARPQWIVTCDPTGKIIYIWEYNGTDYEVARYQYL